MEPRVGILIKTYRNHGTSVMALLAKLHWSTSVISDPGQGGRVVPWSRHEPRRSAFYGNHNTIHSPWKAQVQWHQQRLKLSPVCLPGSKYWPETELAGLLYKYIHIEVCVQDIHIHKGREVSKLGPTVSILETKAEEGGVVALRDAAQRGDDSGNLARHETIAM